MGTSLVFFCALGGCLVTPEQSFFSPRKSAPEGPRIEELLETLKNSGDEGARIAAIGELRLLDTQGNPKVVQGMIETLKDDRKPGVRAEVAVSLARMRPVKPEIGQALESAIAKDSSMRVRMQARSALLQYNLAGYRATAPATATAAAQGDPLGQIVREVAPETPPITKPNQWMAFQNQFIAPMDPPEPGETGPRQESRPWFRPGKMVVGWMQNWWGGNRDPKPSGSSDPAIATTGHAASVPARSVSRTERGGAPGRTAAGSGSPPSSLGNAGNDGPIPMFPPVPEFQPVKPAPETETGSGGPKK